jgi:Protein of unknown function (DUF2652)
MDSKTQHGYLVLADISGYTGFVAQTELEHAHRAMSYLLETIVEKMGGALTIVKLEGDAILAYGDATQLPQGEAFVGLLDQIYRAFRDRAETLHQSTTCGCKACQALPTPDLKFLVHYGEFMRQQIAGIQDLLGSDVNLVHRLLKNRVAEVTGWRGYALFTRPGLERAHVDPQAFVPQREAYEHFGDVDTFVIDMHVRYVSRQAAE